MAVEEKLTQVNIRQGQNVIKRIPISVDASNIIYDNRTLADIINSGLDVENKLNKGGWDSQDYGKLLFINNHGNIEPDDVNNVITQTLRIPRTIDQLDNYNADLLAIQRRNLNNFLKEDADKTQEHKYQNNLFKEFYNNISVTSANSDAIQSLKDSTDRHFEDIENRILILDKNDTDDNKGIVYQNQSKINELSATIETNLPAIIGDINIQSQDFLSLSDLQARKMDNITVKIGEDNQGNEIREGLTSEDLIRLKKIIQIENVAQGVALGNNNLQTQKIAIWGSDDQKIAIYVKHQTGESAPEKYGLFVRTDGLHVMRYSPDDWDTKTEVYNSNSYIPGESVSLVGGVYSGFISHGSERVFFFIPTPKSCVGYNSNSNDQTARRVILNFGKLNNKGMSIRSNSGYLDKDTSEFEWKNMKFDLLGCQNGIRVLMTKNGGGKFSRVTNNTPLSIWFYEDIRVEFK